MARANHNNLTVNSTTVFVDEVIGIETSDAYITPRSILLSNEGTDGIYVTLVEREQISNGEEDDPSIVGNGIYVKGGGQIHLIDIGRIWKIRALLASGTSSDLVVSSYKFNPIRK